MPAGTVKATYQDELEAELTQMFEQYDSSATGNDYLVLGTADLKAWRAGLNDPKPIGEMLA
jgi:hypothetical protein